MEPELAEKKHPCAWVIAVSMGYGHQRTACPLRHLAPEGRVINANDYLGIPEKDKKTWERSRNFYEFISRFKRIPVVGNIAFSFYNKFQEILAYYPKRDLSEPNFVLKQIARLINKGWGEHLINQLKIKPLPLIDTFFTSALMAEIHNYPNDIYCVVCDADISRTWAAPKPQESRIRYFAPTDWVVNRLKLYGVKAENIFLTGYPLPMENIGSENLEILKNDLRRRILNLDPQKKYIQRYGAVIKDYLGELPDGSNRPLTIMFSVGGAGAQKEIGMQIIQSLAEKIKAGLIKVILAAGIRESVENYFLDNIKKLALDHYLNQSIEIVSSNTIENYFTQFNQKLRTADILWTKPSELSFYTALGIPIIIAPVIGSQEEINRKWLLSTGAGMLQENPKYTHQWLFDSLESGRFAEASIQGFVKGEKLGTLKIEQIVCWRK